MYLMDLNHGKSSRFTPRSYPLPGHLGSSPEKIIDSKRRLKKRGIGWDSQGGYQDAINFHTTERPMVYW